MTTDQTRTDGHRPLHFRGAQVVLPDGVVETGVTIADGAIAEIGGGPNEATVVEATGLAV